MKKRMLEGSLYIVDDELRKDQKIAHEFMEKYNTFTLSIEERKDMLKQTLKKIGKNAFITPPFYIDYGYNISIGEHFYANFDCVFLDVNSIEIGNYVYLGPRVSIYTATHPLDKELRRQGFEYGKPVKIGNDVWIGGNVTINPGVTIGNGVVIASGSVVTKDILDDVLVAGIPAKVVKSLKK